VVNPSYFAPYAFRIFAEIDPTHDWKGLVDTSYEVLEKSMAATLDKSKSAGLPPDWMTISRTDASVHIPQGGAKTNFGYDALRMPWRIGLDWIWYKEPRAQKLLTSMDFLGDEWKRDSMLHAEYAHDGEVINLAESPAMYGGTIAYFMAEDPQMAKVIYETKLQGLYSHDTSSWKVSLGYYDSNWAWFGIALYNNELPNLWKSR
jgi:endoglucanase